MPKMRKTYILLIVISMLIFPVASGDNQSNGKNITYRVLVDQYYGFYRVFEMYDNMFGEEIYPDNNFQNGTFNRTLSTTLNISRGDTVIWINDAIPDRKLIFISAEKLWSIENGTLKHNGKEFGYTFNKSGIYYVLIKGRKLLRQKITVGPIEIKNTTKIKKLVPVANSTNRKIINLPTNNSISVLDQQKGKQENEAVILIAITSFMIYIFERKIK